MKLPYPEAIERLCTIHDGIRQRCYNEWHVAFKNYGGRGITLANDLATWPEFVQYVSTLDGFDDTDLSLDRIDNNSGYYKGNLKFSTRKEQARNRRGFYAPNLEAMKLAKMSVQCEGTTPAGAVFYVVRCDVCGYTFRRRGKELSVEIQPCRKCCVKAKEIAPLLDEPSFPRHSLVVPTTPSVTSTVVEPALVQSQEDSKRPPTNITVPAVCSETRPPETQPRAPRKSSHMAPRLEPGFRSGDWEVISNEVVRIKSGKGLLSLLCRCVQCGKESFVDQGPLRRGVPKRCLECFNRKQRSDAQERRLAAMRADAERSLSIYPIAPQPLAE